MSVHPRVQHAAHNAMEDPTEIARFHDRCSDLMRALLEALATTPDEPRPFPAVEDELGWPHRRIASVLGGVARLRRREFEGRRPYRFLDERHAASGRWEIWMDSRQARVIRATQRAEARDEPAVCDRLQLLPDSSSPATAPDLPRRSKRPGVRW